MSDDGDDIINEFELTRPKKHRTEAQIAATARMRQAREEKTESKKGLTADEKKLRLKAIREQLNGPLKKDMPPKAELKPKPKPEPEPEPEEDEDDVESEPEPETKPKAVKPKKKEIKVVSKPKPKKEPKVIYETESESEEEVIVVKKKKKPKRKTIIYEDATESEEEVVTKRSVPLEPVRKERDTKTQQNVSTKFKVTPGIAEKPKPPATLYYFAD
jgi:hypothetical protein